MRGPLAPKDGASGPLMRVREALLTIGVTPSGVVRALGHEPARDLSHDEPGPARQVLAERDDAAATLITTLLLGDDVPMARARDPLIPLDDLIALGIVRRQGDVLRALLKVEPLTRAGGLPGWVVSDFRRVRPLPADHVLGLGGAATSLSNLTIRERVDSALDLGTGSGVQLLHLADHAAHVTGTDINARALVLARISLGLNGVDARLLEGDRYAPVSSERFDLIVANPPMVIGSTRTLTYRDSGLEGDAMSALVTRRSVDHLTDGGRSQLLAHWLHVEGQDWRQRVADWIPGASDAWVVQREALAPEDYVAMWREDSGDDGAAASAGGPPSPAARDDWLAWFGQHRVEAIGMGWITVQRTGGARGTLRLEDLRHAVEQPVGRCAAELLNAWCLLRTAGPDRLLALVLAVPSDVSVESVAAARAGARPRLVQAGGLRRTAPTDEFGASVVARCDGHRTLEDVLRGACSEFDIDLRDVLEGALDAVSGLIEAGFLVPAQQRGDRVD